MRVHLFDDDNVSTSKISFGVSGPLPYLLKCA